MSALRIAIVIVGDEILRGQVRDENGYYMATKLCEIGACLDRLVVVGDVVDEIAAVTRDLSATHDYVLVSGGVGPTHDDVTMDGVAKAFDLSLVRHPKLRALIESWKGPEAGEEWLRMSEVPEGTETIPVDGHFPVVQVKNVFVLPGIPGILRSKLEAVLGRLASTERAPRTLRYVYPGGEFGIASALRKLAKELRPDVSVGSYPKRAVSGTYYVELTLTSRDPGALERAASLLQEMISEVKPAGEPLP
jgi:molybdenum cofactor synthesis domain-containing protein